MEHKTQKRSKASYEGRRRQASVIIVDDHPMIRMAAAITLERSGMNVVAEADNGVDAIQLTKQLTPDVMILDIGIPNLDGLTVIKRTKALDNPPGILVLTSFDGDVYARRCHKAGASGFINKSLDMSALVRGVQCIVDGYTFFPSSVTSEKYEQINDDEDVADKLSNRELIVLQQLLKGMSNKEISDLMLLSNKTISTYKQRIFEKLNVSNIIDLADVAKRHNLYDGMTK